MRTTAGLFVLLILSAPASIKADFDLQSLSAAAVMDMTTLPQTAPAPAPTQEKEWTIMVYMNGRSNIEPFALNDINRIESIGSSERVNIVVELGRSKGLENDTAADGDWQGARRYFIVRDADKDRIASPVLMDRGDIDMGNYKEVVSFMSWAKQNFKAKRYMLIIWDHGWGWIDPTKPGKYKSISHDFVTGNYIKTTELGRIFREAGRVDLYASMACFMQMAEVAYELKDSAEVIVGSEEVIQLPSFNFEDFLARMLAAPRTSAVGAGIYLTDTFLEMYSRPEYADMLEKTKYGIQLSAIRANMLPALAQRAKYWSEMAMRVNDTAAYKKAKTDLLRFEIGDETTDPDKQISFYGDLYHFIELINLNLNLSIPNAPHLKAVGEEFKNFITRSLTIRNVYLGKDRTGKHYSNTHGISIHIPGRPGNLIGYYPSYSDLAFERASGWKRFSTYLEQLK